MFKKINIIIIIILIINPSTLIFAEENFFSEAQKKYEEKKLEESKFLFQRNIIFSPKDAKSYLYLAKIYNAEKNQKEEQKNLNTTLLLEPNNEEAIYMLIKIQLKKSNYSKVKELKKNFEIACTKLCDNLKNINETLKNIEPKNES
jgi:tetratricopeptide (TPR) repeat protein